MIMANVFNRTSPALQPVSTGGQVYAYDVQQFSKQVETENGSKVTHVRFENVPVKILAERSDIPESDKYLLSEMLRQGYAPDEVNVSNLLNSSDPLDSSNVADLDNFSKVFEKEQDSFDSVDNNNV